VKLWYYRGASAPLSFISDLLTNDKGIIMQPYSITIQVYYINPALIENEPYSQHIIDYQTYCLSSNDEIYVDETSIYG
jgi:hypothetical protein|tara:strand:- start:234 stop:467 length:234 start_codon:yes stop_codon:yes gene_type:complete